MLILDEIVIYQNVNAWDCGGVEYAGRCFKGGQKQISVIIIFLFVLPLDLLVFENPLPVHCILVMVEPNLMMPINIYA